MKKENLIYRLEVLANTPTAEIESDEFEVLWEDEKGMECWSTESIANTAAHAAFALKNSVSPVKPSTFKQQLVMSHLLAERSEVVGTDFEDGTYEQGVRDALKWVAGEMVTPPFNIEEHQDFADAADGLITASKCKTMGPTCRGCPDCGPVMGDATYQAMFGQQQDGV